MASELVRGTQFIAGAIWDAALKNRSPMFYPMRKLTGTERPVCRDRTGKTDQAGDNKS